MDFLNLTNFESTQPEMNNVIPVDDYAFEIEQVEMKRSKAGNDIVNITLGVCAGPYKKQKVWHVLNLFHSNPQVVEISKNALSTMLSCIGVSKEDQNFGSFQELQDTLEGETVFARTKVQKSEEYGDKAVVHYFINADDEFKRKLKEKLKAPKKPTTKKKASKKSTNFFDDAVAPQIDDAAKGSEIPF